MKFMRFIVLLLIVVGALNWGLVGLGMLLGMNLNVVNLLVGGWPTVEAIVYLLVGISVVLKLFHKSCQNCMPGGEMKM